MRMNDYMRRVSVALLILVSLTVGYVQGASGQTNDQVDGVELAAYSDPNEPDVFWIAYRPITQQPYSFWYTGEMGGQNGINAHWRLPDGLQLGDVQFPSLMETGDMQAPTFVFAPDARLLQQVRLPDGETTLPLTIELDLIYGQCDDNSEGDCVQQTGSARLNIQTSDLPVYEGTHVGTRISTRMRGNWVRVDDRGINMVMHRAYNDDGPISRAFFLPVRPDLFIGAAPLRMAAYEERGFYTLFPARDGIAHDQVFEGILVLDKPAEKGLEFYRIMPQNDTARAADASELNASDASGNPREHISYVMALGLAFLGGLILNVMPCVFPVLALKVFSAIKSAHQKEAAVRRDALAYTFGVVASFAAIAAILIAIRAFGDGAGWGYQLQSPIFVLAMALVFFTMALNFLGVFEIPGFLSSAGQSLTERGGVTGSFFTGTLATLVAAPCTAPFMVTAVAFALAQPLGLALGVFVFMGLGLASPYLLIGYVPASRRFFPRPGAWMQTFRSFLAFPMLATVIWLVWILSIQTGATGVLLAMVPMFAIAFVFWLWRHLAGAWRAAAVILCAMVVFYVFNSVQSTAPLSSVTSQRDVTVTTVQASKGHMPVIPFSPERLGQLRAEGRDVFIHHWAAWCIICVLHDQMIFSTPEFQSYMLENNIVFMMADRTHNDPALVAYMEEQYGRSNQPIDVFWSSKKGSTPLVLPQLFTRAKLIAMIEAKRKVDEM